VVDLLHLGNDEFIFWDGAHVAPLHKKKESEMKVQKISLKHYFDHKDKSKIFYEKPSDEIMEILDQVFQKFNYKWSKDLDGS